MPGSQDFAADPRNADLFIYLNGDLVKHADARVSVFDAGFVLGDGVWEGLRLHRGRLLFLEAHLQRLYKGFEDIALPFPLTQAQLTAEIHRLLDANRMTDGAHLRLMVTRGEKAAVNQDPRNWLGRPTVVITAEYKEPSPEILTRGLALATSEIVCTPAEMWDMRINSHSRLALIRALIDAIAKGGDEALMLDPNGFVSSCNATNFFWVKDGRVMTSTGDYCFNGVTRANVIALCRRHEIPITLGDFELADVAEADEAFVTGTFGGLTPVRSLDGRDFPGALPGPVTATLRAHYEALKDEDAGL